MSKYYSIIIVSKDGEETARFDGLRAPELLRKIEASIEVGSFAIVDEGKKEEQNDAAGGGDHIRGAAGS